MAARRRRARKNAFRLFNLDWALPAHVGTVLEGRWPATFILGHRRQEVVGESFRAGALMVKLRQLLGRNMGRVEPDGVRAIAISIAWLVREPTNEKDPNAVAVFVEDVHAGYLPREAAPRWRDVLEYLEGRYLRRVACTAMILGHHEGGGPIGVWLMLDTDIRKPWLDDEDELLADDIPY